MAEQPGSSTGDAVREDADDHDLLTFSEVGARLAEEVSRLEHEAAGAPSPQEAQALRARAETLRAAASRNDRRAVEQPGVSGFLAYRPGGKHQDE